MSQWQKEASKIAAHGDAAGASIDLRRITRCFYQEVIVDTLQFGGQPIESVETYEVVGQLRCAAGILASWTRPVASSRANGAQSHSSIPARPRTPENVPRLCGEDGCVAVWLCGCVAVELRFVLEAAMSLDAMLGSRLAATEADAQ